MDGQVVKGQWYIQALDLSNSNIIHPKYFQEWMQERFSSLLVEGLVTSQEHCSFC